VPQPAEVFGAHRRGRFYLDADHAATAVGEDHIHLDAVAGSKMRKLDLKLAEPGLAMKLADDEIFQEGANRRHRFG
jgi:hypothetical protein